MPFHPIPFRHLLSLLLLAGLSGCALTGQDQLEAELRDRDASIRNLEQQLADAEQKLRQQEQELVALEDRDDSPFRLASSGKTLESAAAWGAVHELKIHPLASGVFPDEENSLSANLMLQPLDQDGEVLKVAGQLQIQIRRTDTAEVLAELNASRLDSRSLWSNGLVARGYQVQLPLTASSADELPKTGDQLLVTATLSLGKDRRFDCSQLITIR